MSKAKKIKLAIDAGEYTAVKRTAKSEIFNVFEEIKCNDELIKNFVVCSRCKNVYIFNDRCTSNLFRHSCFKKYKAAKVTQVPKVESNDELKNKCTELVVQWVIGNCRPLNVVNDDGFLNLAQFCISAGYEFGNSLDVRSLMPHPTAVCRNITALCEDQQKSLKEELYSIKDIGFSITYDLWSDNYLKTSYIGATIHYIKSGIIVNKTLGMIGMRSDSTTGIKIRNKIESMLQEFDCNFSEKIIVVTDRGLNVKASFQDEISIFCINHLLNNVIDCAISNSLEVNATVTSCFKLVKYFKNSDINSALSATFKSYMPTRWNNVFYLLKSIQMNWVDLTQILQDNKDISSELVHLNIANINEIIEILNPFEEVSKLLEGEKYPTIHHVYPQIRNLKKIISKDHQNDSETGKKFKEQLLIQIESVIDINIKELHKIALFLFPPANKLQNFTQNEKRNIHEKCRNLLRTYESTWTVSNIKIETVNPDDDPFTEFIQTAVKPEYEEEVINEILRYESQTIPYHKEFDPLGWWEDRKSEYPLLYKLSSFILATPATSAPSQRLFSKARHLLSEQQSVLGKTPSSVNQIMFLHNNLDINNLNLKEE